MGTSSVLPVQSTAYTASESWRGKVILAQMKPSKPSHNTGNAGTNQKRTIPLTTTETLTSSNDAAVISDADCTTSQASRLS